MFALGKSVHLSWLGRRGESSQDWLCYITFCVLPVDAGDGHITLDELRSALSSCGCGVTESELETVMKEADVDGSGAIDYGEFLAATVNLALLEREEVLIKVFEELDEVRELP